MIKTISIDGLRGISGAVVPNCRPITVLIGANGSGKSTVLDALAIAAYPAPCTGLMLAASRRRNVPDGARWLFARGDAGMGSLRVQLDDSEHGRRLVQARPSLKAPTKLARLLKTDDLSSVLGVHVALWETPKDAMEKEDYETEQHDVTKDPPAHSGWVVFDKKRVS